MSQDKAHIVFVKQLGSRPNHEIGGTPATEVNQLWVVDSKEPSEPKLILDSPMEVDRRRFWALHSPVFSGDDKSVYFLVDFAATASAVVRVTLAERKVTLVATRVLDFSVIAAGKYKGHLIAHEHRAKLAPGYYDWYWLLRPDGTEIGVVGEDRNDVDLFLEMYGANQQ